MDLKARIAAFESGTPLPQTPPSPPRSSPSVVTVDEFSRTSLEAARRRERAGSSASAVSSNGGGSVGSAGWGDAPAGLGVGQLKPSSIRRVGSNGSPSLGSRPPPPLQVTLNGGTEGGVPRTRTSPKVDNSSIISLFPAQPLPSPSATSSAPILAPSLRSLQPFRSPSPSLSLTSATNDRTAISLSNSTSSIALNDFSARFKPSRSSPSTSSLPTVSSTSSSLLRKPPPPPPTPQSEFGLPEPKAAPLPPSTPKAYRSQSARAGPTLSLRTAIPKGSSDTSDMISFSPIDHPTRSGSGFTPTPRRQASTPLTGLERGPPPLPSRPSQQTPLSLVTSPSKHKPSLSTSSFQSVELEGSETEEDSLATPIASSGPSPNLSRTSSASSASMRPPPLPQRKPTIPFAPIPAPLQPSSPIAYTPRVRRVPPPPPASITLSPRPSFTGRAPPPTLLPKPASFSRLVPQPSQAALARYGSLFTKLVASRRVAAMQAMISPSADTPRSSGGVGWKRASLVFPGLGGEEGSGGERLEGRVVRIVWERSRLEGTFLKGVWDRADPRRLGSLDREAFVKGMGEIDEELGRMRRVKGAGRRA